MPNPYAVIDFFLIKESLGLMQTPIIKFKDQSDEEEENKEEKP